MQSGSGYSSGYKNPAAPYLSKWFIDTYSLHDNDIYSTLQQIAVMFEIDTKLLSQMIKYETKSNEWQELARKLNLIGNK